MINYLISFYQKFISPPIHYLMAPLTHSLNACRFTPTCSQYTKKAIQRYGIITGLVLGTKRFLRCNPLFPGGHDPVPDLN